MTGVAFLRQLIGDLGGTFAAMNDRAAGGVRPPLGGTHPASPLRNISPRRPLEPRPALRRSPKERLDELRHS